MDISGRKNHTNIVGNFLHDYLRRSVYVACVLTLIAGQISCTPGSGDSDIASGNSASGNGASGSNVVAQDSEDFPVRKKVSIEPIKSGAHSITVSWIGTDDSFLRFSLFQVLNGDDVRLATSDNSSSPAVLTRSLELNGEYFLSIWAVSGQGEFTVNTETLSPKQYSQAADTSIWALAGPASTLDFEAAANTDGWGRTLLRIGDVLLVGGDFQGIKPARNSSNLTVRPWLVALNADTGRPVTTFAVPEQINSVVRSLVLSPDGSQVYVGGDFGLLALNASTGAVDFRVDVGKDVNPGRVFKILTTDTQLYIGGDFSEINNSPRLNVARLSLLGELDTSWDPSITGGTFTGRSAPVQTLALTPSKDALYVGGTFTAINGLPVSTTWRDTTISMLAISTLDGTVRQERFEPELVLGEFEDSKDLIVHDIALIDSYVIIAWGGPNYLTFHQLDGARLQQYSGPGDVQALQVLGDLLIVGHHGEFLGTLTDPLPAEAVVNLDPLDVNPFKLHTFRIDSQSARLLPDQAWAINGTFGVWAIAATVDAIWLAGNLRRAGSNEVSVEGLVRFPVIE